MRLLIATNNKHKLEEYQELFKEKDITLLTPEDLGLKFNPIENGKTYHENSLKKASELKKYSKLPILADDSGIEVEVLGAFPGIHSSRFAKKYKCQEDANNALINLVSDKDNKNAKFVCVLTLLNVEDQPLFFVGETKGKILNKATGNGGFGYDSIFYSFEAKAPFGTLTKDKKNCFSHRYKAVKKLIKYLESNFII